MKNLEIKEFRLADSEWVKGLKCQHTTHESAHHFSDSESFTSLPDHINSNSLFAISNDGQCIGWIGLYPVLDPFGRLGISEIQFGYDPDKADGNCMLLAINFLLIKARSLGFWSCLINLNEESELIPFLYHSGFKLLGQKNSGMNTNKENQLLILEKRLN